MKVCHTLFTIAIVLFQVLAIIIYYYFRNGTNHYLDVIEYGEEGSCTFESVDSSNYYTGVVCTYYSWSHDFICNCPASYTFNQNPITITMDGNSGAPDEVYSVRVDYSKLQYYLPSTTFTGSLDITDVMDQYQVNKICAMQECSVDVQSVYDGQDQCSLHLNKFGTMHKCMSPPCKVSPTIPFPCTRHYFYNDTYSFSIDELYAYSIDEMKEYMERFPPVYYVDSSTNYLFISSMVLVMVQYCIAYKFNC